MRFKPGPPNRSAVPGRSTWYLAVLWLVAFSLVVGAMPALVYADTGHPPVYLRTENGQIINPITGTNADQPYSPEQTCGLSGCHDYNQITQGYHFQQGHDVISDQFNARQPESLSPGMQGKY